ncbi:hypothetical protein GOBAR_AA34162 [Gossypium barbadense]|uniref:Endonuclease/exonuclease/phosphatase domain-containing protein n=1 Tax=Gossypium barbadense TaxID=3634 RepID=A0A2P5W627_GOSBA|nr:hypothetical protein GOBAR_AA34162 [Gossypium barbadense]
MEVIRRVGFCLGLMWVRTSLEVVFLWGDDEATLGHNQGLSWLVKGDFNEIACSFEKRAGGGGEGVGLPAATVWRLPHSISEHSPVLLATSFVHGPLKFDFPQSFRIESWWTREVGFEKELRQLWNSTMVSYRFVWLWSGLVWLVGAETGVQNANKLTWV